MVTVSVLLVLGSAFAHALWNLVTKTSLNKVVFLWLVHVVAFIIVLPFFVYELPNIYIPPVVYGYIVLTMIIHGVYFLLLAQMYKFGELSQVYPIMRGVGALLVPVLSVWIYSETLSLSGWFGLGCIVCGLVAMGMYSEKIENRDKAIISRSLFFAISIGICIAGYILIDKYILNYISPITMIQISNASYVLALGWGSLRSKQIGQVWDLNKKTICLGVVLVPGGYFLFLLAINLAPLSFIAPIREISIVLTTMLGIFILKEGKGRSKIALSAVIAFGVICIGLWG